MRLLELFSCKGDGLCLFFLLDAGERLEGEVCPVIADLNGIALADIAADDLLRQGSLDRMRQQAAQRTDLA